MRSMWCGSDRNSVCLSVSHTGLASGTEAKAQFFDPTHYSLFEFTDEIYYLAGIQFYLNINYIYYLLFILHLQQLVAFLIHPFCPTGFWDGKVLRHPYLYAHCSIVPLQCTGTSFHTITTFHTHRATIPILLEFF
jgi:hypothetical protein